MSVNYTGKAEKPLDLFSVSLFQEKNTHFFFLFLKFCFQGTSLSKMQTSFLTNPLVLE